MMRRLRQSGWGRQARKGIVLLAVLVVVVLLTLAAYQYSELTMAEYKAADSFTRSTQARLLADSGVHYAAALLSQPGGTGSSPFDNPQLFQVLVQESEQPRRQGRFSIVAPLDPDDAGFGQQPYRFGVTDESGKINVNALVQLDSSGQVAHDMLMRLPNMSEEIANAIVDWIDADDEPRPNGAENNSYTSLSPAYRCKNGPLDSLEELLLVRGMTAQLLFGNDRNRNGLLDPDEDDGSGTLDRGLSAYLTVYSREPNVDSQFQARLWVNDSDLQGLHARLTTALGLELADYVLAYRLYGPASSGRSGGSQSGGRSSGSSGQGSGSKPSGGGSPGNSGGASSGGGSSAGLSRNSLDFRRSGRSIGSLFELVNSSVSIPGSTPQSRSTRHESPLNDAGKRRQLLPLLLDKVTTTRDAELPGRINVNTAARAVLAALPNITEADVQSILSHRPGPVGADPGDLLYQTPAWLVTEANLQADTLRGLERYVTARTQVYRVQVVGHFDGGGPAARVEAVIDTNNGRPRIVLWRDLTELGRGFNLVSGEW